MGTLNWQDDFEKVFILRSEVETDMALRARKIFRPDQITVVDEEPLAGVKGRLSADQFSRSKRLLYLAPFKGQFFKRCPGARPGLTCCNYFVLNLGLQCNMNCSYCYLQSFINSPVTKIYTNIDQALVELEAMGKDLSDSSIRIGTGEVIDSLSLDPLTLYSSKLIEFFEKFPKWRLEFKTKSDLVDQFLHTPHGGNVIVSWSVNPQNIIEREEHGTASLESRLQAAQKCRDKGFLISFHIDPMIYHPEWKVSYGSLVDTIAEQFSPEDFPYLSVGALRYQPEQRHMMRDRFGVTSLSTLGEMFPGKDGKLRYDQTLRQEMFQFVIERFKSHNTKWNIFMCMESPETWIQANGQMPGRDPQLKELFDHNVIRKARRSLEANGVAEIN